MAQNAYRTFTGKRPAVAVAALLTLTAAGFVTNAYHHHKEITGRIYRIGADHAPPYYFLRPDGRIEGFAVDTLNEAARRRNVHLKWVRIEKMIVDEAFRKDLV